MTSSSPTTEEGIGVAAPPVRTLIVEDERLARRTLRTIVDAVDWLTCIGEATNADQARSMIRTLDPELIFLDVLLPGGSGIDVLERAPGDAVVVFATAFDSFAYAAFELGAIDYVTKPFGPDRIHRALHRAAAQIRAIRTRKEATARAETAVPSVGARLDAIRAKPLERIFVRDRGLIVPIPVSQIVRCEADGDFVGVISGNRRYLVYLNLGDLSAQLDPERFIRVHRSHVVNVAAVESIRAIDPSRVELQLRDGSKVTASRAGTRALRARMRH